MVRIKLLHNGGAGANTQYEVPEGTTVKDLFFKECGSSADPGQYTIKVNFGKDDSDGAVKGSYVLRNDDIVTFAQNKIPGA